MVKPASSFSAFDAAHYLRDPQTAAAYLESAITESDTDPALIAAALGAIARSGNLSELSRRTGISREGLYKALSAEGNPSFATILTVAKALGLRIEFHAVA